MGADNLRSGCTGLHSQSGFWRSWGIALPRCAGDSPIHINGLLKTGFHQQSEKLKYFTTDQGLQEAARWQLMPFFGIPVPVSRYRGNGATLPLQILCDKLLHWSCFTSKSKRLFFIWELLLIFCECCTKLLTKIPNLQFSWNVHLAPLFSTLKLLTQNATLRILSSWLLLFCLGCEMTRSKVSVYTVHLVRKVLMQLL